MKAILEFDLPADDCPHRVAIHAMDWALVVQDLDNALRNWLKYGHTFSTADEALEATRKTLHEALESRGISLEMID